MNANAWRSVVAALADERSRRVYARAVLGEGVEAELETMSPGAARRVVQTLTKAGLVVRIDDGGLRATDDVFAAVLAAAPVAAQPTGVDRFFVDGRLTVYPARAADRDAVLAHVADRVIAADESIDERAVNERLAHITDDVAAMRRYLVDAGLLVRSRDGHVYARAA